MKTEALLIGGIGAAAVAAAILWPRKGQAAELAQGVKGNELAGLGTGASSSSSTSSGPSPFASSVSPLAGLAPTNANGLLDQLAAMLGTKPAILDPDSIQANESPQQWASRVATKYNGRTVAEVPAVTRAALVAWFREVSAAVHKAGSPAYNQAGVPVALAMPPPAAQWQLPRFYWIVRRTAGEYQADFDRALSYWDTPSNVVVVNEIRCQRDWGFLGTGISLGTLIGAAGAVVGSIFGPAGTAVGGAVGGIVGKVV